MAKRYSVVFILAACCVLRSGQGKVRRLRSLQVQRLKTKILNRLQHSRFHKWA